MQSAYPDSAGQMDVYKMRYVDAAPFILPWLELSGLILYRLFYLFLLLGESWKLLSTAQECAELKLEWGFFVKGKRERIAGSLASLYPFHMLEVEIVVINQHIEGIVGN